MSKIEELTFERFIELYVRQKLSMEKIGEMYDVSRQRVHQRKKELEKKHGRIERKSTIDSFTLKRLLDEGMSPQDISDSFHLKVSKVNRLIRKYEADYKNGLSSIKIVRKKTEDVLPKALLYQLYVVELMTDKEIAERYDCSPATVWLLRKRYNIYSFHSKSLRKLPLLLPREKFYNYHVEHNYTLQQLADMCKCDITSILKLKQFYDIKK